MTEGKAKGFTPVIVIPTAILHEAFDNSAQQGDDYKPKSIINRAETIDIKAIFGKLKEQSMSWAEDYDIYGEFSYVEPVNNFETLFDCSTNRVYQKIIIAKIPTNKPWEVAAWIPMGGFNECPSPEEQVAIFKYWFKKYGSIPAVVGYDTWELYINQPVRAVDEAESLAVEQFSFCSDIVTQGTGTINSLAGTIINSNVWSFWWD